MSRSRALRFDSIAEFDAHRRSRNGYVDTGTITEADVLPMVLEALRRHPRVAWVWRMNTGGMWEGVPGKSRYIKFGFKGMADITGQLKDGRRLEVECKSPTGRLEDDQAAFLAAVRAGNGVAFVARSAVDVFKEIPDMILTLTEGEIRKAIQHYLVTKTKGVEIRDLDVSLHWRGRAPYATVHVLKPPPVLTDSISKSPGKPVHWQQDNGPPRI